MPGDRGSVTAIRTTTIRTIQTPSAAPGDGTLSPDIAILTAGAGFIIFFVMPAKAGIH
jgi:hypothetical protein